MTNPRFGIRFPVTHKEQREFIIAEDCCPECGGELDTGFECNRCGFDAMPECKNIDIEKRRKGSDL